MPKRFRNCPKAPFLLAYRTHFSVLIYPFASALVDHQLQIYFWEDPHISWLRSILCLTQSQFLAVIHEIFSRLFSKLYFYLWFFFLVCFQWGLEAVFSLNKTFKNKTEYKPSKGTAFIRFPVREHSVHFIKIHFFLLWCHLLTHI